MKTELNYVSVYSQKESLSSFCKVFDFSKPIIETTQEHVSFANLTSEMTILSAAFNPFMKQVMFLVEETKVIYYACVFQSYDYITAVRYAKKYAKENGLYYSTC